MTKEYFGTKRVTAWPDVHLRGGADGPAVETHGYRVKYEDGYISWSPKFVFEAAYQPIDAMSFGHAIAALKAGERVCRAGWNGKNMWLILVSGSSGLTVDQGRPLAKAGLEVGTTFNYLPHIDMWTAQGDLVPWLASQSDMLADDWMIVSARERAIAA